jgi:hypothetical protein
MYTLRLIVAIFQSKLKKGCRSLGQLQGWQNLSMIEFETTKKEKNHAVNENEKSIEMKEDYNDEEL